MKPLLQVYTAQYCAAIQVLENFFNCGDGLTFSSDSLVGAPHVNTNANITTTTSGETQLVGPCSVHS